MGERSFLNSNLNRRKGGYKKGKRFRSGRFKNKYEDNRLASYLELTAKLRGNFHSNIRFSRRFKKRKGFRDCPRKSVDLLYGFKNLVRRYRACLFRSLVLYFLI